MSKRSRSPSYSRISDDDSISVMAGDESFDHDGYSKYDDEEVLSEIDSADSEDDTYKEYSESVKSSYRDPLDEEFAKMNEGIWGKAKIDRKSKGKIPELKIPFNCKCMATPRLNGPIYAELYQSARDRDRAVASRQKQNVTAALPVIRVPDSTEIVQVQTESQHQGLGCKENEDQWRRGVQRGPQESLLRSEADLQ